MKLRLACVLPILMLVSCGGDPLPKPDLLNHPESEWPARTARMSTEELFYVHRYNLSLKPPYDSSFADYLGVRGKEAVSLWIANLESGLKPKIDQYYLYSPIIRQAFYRGGYDLCSDTDMLNRAATALIRPTIARNMEESLRNLRRVCVKNEDKRS